MHNTTEGQLEDAILETLVDEAPLSANDIASRIHDHPLTVDRICSRLHEQEYISQTKRGQYEMTRRGKHRLAEAPEETLEADGGSKPAVEDDREAEIEVKAEAESEDDR